MGRINSERVLVSFYAVARTPLHMHVFTLLRHHSLTHSLDTGPKQCIQKQNQLQDTRYHVMHRNSHPARGPSPLPRQKHSGVSPLRSCAVVFIRGFLLAGRVGTGVLWVVARVGRVVAEGLHACSRGGVVGLQRALARPVEDDAGVDEETDEGGAREEESN